MREKIKKIASDVREVSIFLTYPSGVFIIAAWIFPPISAHVYEWVPTALAYMALTGVVGLSISVLLIIGCYAWPYPEERDGDEQGR